MRKGKGLISLLVSFGLVAVIGGSLLAIARMNNINSLEDLYSYTKRHSDKVKDCYEAEGKGCVTLPAPPSEQPKEENRLSDEELNYNGPEKGIAFLQDEAKLKKDYSVNKLNEIKTTKLSKAKYNEEEWPHWALVSGANDCWTTKKEVLAKQAIPGTVKYLDKNHKETTDKSKACAIISGKWTDPYTGKEIDKVEDIDVDHIIPLKIINSLGGDSWTAEKRLNYANDIESVLIVASKESIKKRNGEDLSKFTLANKSYKCEFAKSYTGIASKYELSITEKTKDELSKWLNTCTK